LGCGEWGRFRVLLNVVQTDADEMPGSACCSRGRRKENAPQQVQPCSEETGLWETVG